MPPRPQQYIPLWVLYPLLGVLLFILGLQFRLASLSHPQGAGHAPIESSIADLERAIESMSSSLLGIEVRLARIEQWQSKLRVPPPEQLAHNDSMKSSVAELKAELRGLMAESQEMWRQLQRVLILEHRDLMPGPETP